MFHSIVSPAFISCKLSATNPRALLIFLHTDDIEVENPLGSHVKKHKLSMFYFTLGNITPMFRSRAAIQLLAVARTNDITLGGPIVAWVLHNV